MNRNLDGSQITTDQLIAIAVDHELKTLEELKLKRGHIHCEPLFRSEMISLTAETRLAMFWKMKLELK